VTEIKEEHMNFKNLKLAMALGASTFLLVACAGAPTAAPAAESKPAAAKQLKVAVVMPSPATDKAFSQSMADALKSVQAEMGGEAGMKLAMSENMFKVPDAAAALRDYAQQGYDIVIAHGTQYGNSLQEIAKDFPNTAFAWGTATDTFESKGLKNVHAYNPKAQEGGYVLGVIAAKMSKSGVIGVNGPVEAGDAKTYVEGFKKGVMATNANAKVSVTYTGSFSDVPKMAAAAETHAQNGADVMTGSSQSVVGAIGVAKDKKLLWFGTQSDQSSLAPETVGASQVYDWSGAIKEIIAMRNAGKNGGKAFELTLKNGGLKIVYNDKVAISADAKAAADAAIKGITDGSINPMP
jgi:basic membrane protein A